MEPRKRKKGTKLTTDELLAIAVRYPYTPDDELARLFDISIYTIKALVTKNHWRKTPEFISALRRDIALRTRAADHLNTPESKAKRGATHHKIIESDKIRLRLGLQPMSKRHYRTEPKKKQMQKNYLRRNGYIVDDETLTAYYTPSTKRCLKLEAIKRGEKKGNIRPYYDFVAINPASDNND